MKRKINARFVLLTVMSVVLTLILATMAYYALFKKEVLADLRSYTYVLQHADSAVTGVRPIERGSAESERIEKEHPNLGEKR